MIYMSIPFLSCNLPIDLLLFTVYSLKHPRKRRLLSVSMGVIDAGKELVGFPSWSVY